MIFDNSLIFSIFMDLKRKIGKTNNKLKSDKGLDSLFLVFFIRVATTDICSA